MFFGIYGVHIGFSEADKRDSYLEMIREKVNRGEAFTYSDLDKDFDKFCNMVANGFDISECWSKIGWVRDTISTSKGNPIMTYEINLLRKGSCFFDKIYYILLPVPAKIVENVSVTYRSIEGDRPIVKREYGDKVIYITENYDGTITVKHRTDFGAGFDVYGSITEPKVERSVEQCL